MNPLREAAQQALEALKFSTPNPRSIDDDYAEQGWKEHIAAVAALRAALAQQAEPRNQCRSDGRCQYAIDHGAEGMGHCPKGKCVMAQHAQPAEDRAVAQSNLRVMKEMFREQAEPVAWVASKDGRVIYDDASTDDGLLRVSGDFENDEQRISYAKQIVDKLNAAPAQQAEPVEPVAWVLPDALDWKPRQSETVTKLTRTRQEKYGFTTSLYTAPPQRTMVPLTEEEIYHATGHFGVSEHTAIKIARAVEKASWEKNHGQA